MKVTKDGYYDHKGNFLGWARYAYDDVSDQKYKWLIFWPPHSKISVHVKVRKGEV